MLKVVDRRSLICAGVDIGRDHGFTVDAASRDDAHNAFTNALI